MKNRIIRHLLENIKGFLFLIFVIAPLGCLFLIGSIFYKLLDFPIRNNPINQKKGV